MLESFGLSDPGSIRTNNEDYYVLSSDRGLYVVADGMGGAQAGEHASKLAVETVCSYVEKACRSDADVLAEAFVEANRRVFDAASRNDEMEGMGTTLVAVLEAEAGPELFVASVGDSRAYVYDGRELVPVTEDQTWVHEVGRRLGIDEGNLKTHPMRHVLTMAIGVSPELRVHSYALTPKPGTLVLLCSDGLHGVVELPAIQKELSGNGTLEAKCHRLIDAAKAAGGPDNITAVLLKIQ
jgi:serine/threonine protein phosphatase PrpC